MYLHIGNGYVVRKQSIIGVFDIENTSVSKHTQTFLYNAEKEGRVISVSPDMPKAFVVSDEQVFLTPISAATLKKRCRHAPTGNP